MSDHWLTNGFQTYFTSEDGIAHTESLQQRYDNNSSSSSKACVDSQAPVPAATSTAAVASTSDDCCKVCLMAPHAGFALMVTCGHAVL